MTADNFCEDRGKYCEYAQPHSGLVCHATTCKHLPFLDRVFKISNRMFIMDLAAWSVAFFIIGWILQDVLRVVAA